MSFTFADLFFIFITFALNVVKEFIDFYLKNYPDVRGNEIFVVFFGKTCYIKNNGFIMLSQRWTICDVVFGSLNLKNVFEK